MMNGYHYSHYALLRQGPNATKKVVMLEKFNSIGRGVESSIPLLSIYVSREHCYLNCTELRSGLVWTIEDTGSLNGTYLNDEKLEKSKVRELKLGDYIGFGVDCLDYIKSLELQQETKFYVYQLVSLLDHPQLAEDYMNGLCNDVENMDIDEMEED